MNTVIKRQVSIFSLTEAGETLAEQVRLTCENGNHRHKAKPFAETVQSAFNKGDALVLICATGIAVRTLAPVIKHKLQDPPVLVLDEAGQFVIPLLSGHEGGANEWAAALAKEINAQAVITTAQTYTQPVYTIGMGCERGCSEEDLKSLLDDALVKADLSLDDITSLNSIALKADEEGLIALSKTLGMPFDCFEKDELLTVEELLSTHSDYVFETVGVYGVAESAALYAAQSETNHTPELVLKKIKSAKATCAIARAYR